MARENVTIRVLEQSREMVKSIAKEKGVPDAWVWRAMLGVASTKLPEVRATIDRMKEQM